MSHVSAHATSQAEVRAFFAVSDLMCRALVIDLELPGSALRSSQVRKRKAIEVVDLDEDQVIETCTSYEEVAEMRFRCASPGLSGLQRQGSENDTPNGAQPTLAAHGAPNGGRRATGVDVLGQAASQAA